MDVVDQGAVADSPSASPEPQTPGTDQSNGNGQPAQDLTPFHQHPRWQQMLRERDAARAQATQHGQSLQAIQKELAALKQTAQAPAGTPQERFEKQQAIEALKGLLGEDADLKSLLELAKMAPQLRQRMQGVDSIQKAQIQALHRTGRDSINALVKAENIDAKFARRIEHLIAAEIAETDGAEERYLSGDLSVIQDAFNAIKPDLALLQRNAQQGVIDAKQRTQRLPPASTRGGGPGQDPPLTLDPNADTGTVRKFMDSVSKRAAAVINGG